MKRCNWTRIKLTLQKKSFWTCSSNTSKCEASWIQMSFHTKTKRKKMKLRYKARLVAHGFLQRHGIYFYETYSPVMDAITFRYLISLVAHEGLNLYMMDVVIYLKGSIWFTFRYLTAYLYGSLDSEIYMHITLNLEKATP